MEENRWHEIQLSKKNEGTPGENRSLLSSPPGQTVEHLRLFSVAALDVMTVMTEAPVATTATKLHQSRS